MQDLAYSVDNNSELSTSSITIEKHHNPKIRSRSSTLEESSRPSYNNSLLSQSSIYISQKEAKSSVDTFKHLLKSALIYKVKLEDFSNASSDFAAQIEDLAKIKGVDEAENILNFNSIAVGLQSISGLQYVLATHLEILAQTIDKSVITPLRNKLKEFEDKLKLEESERQKTLAYISHKIKVTEARSLDTAKRGTRDLNQFRKALAELTSQVDDMERVNEEHYTKLYEWQQQNGLIIQDCLSSFIKAEVDILDRIISKCIQDEFLKKIITDGPEPFSIYERVDNMDKQKDIFSVLPTIPIFEQAPHHLSNAVSYHTFLTNTNSPHPTPPPTPMNVESSPQVLPLLEMTETEEKFESNEESNNRSSPLLGEDLYYNRSSPPLMSDHSLAYYYDSQGNSRNITPLISPYPPNHSSPAPLIEIVDYGDPKEKEKGKNIESENSDETIQNSNSQLSVSISSPCSSINVEENPKVGTINENNIQMKKLT